MTFTLKDRVYETSVSTGTGDFTLAGAVSSFQGFDGSYGHAGNVFPYVIECQLTGEWEVGNTTLSGTTTLVRDGNQEIIASSNAGSAVSFGIGSKNVFSSAHSKYYTPIKQVTVTASPATSAANTAVVANGASLVVIPLPIDPIDGDVFEVRGAGAGGWQISQILGQIVYFSDVATTSGTGGSLASTNAKNNIRLNYVTALSGWTVASSSGNITVV